MLRQGAKALVSAAKTALSRASQGAADTIAASFQPSNVPAVQLIPIPLNDRRNNTPRRGGGGGDGRRHYYSTRSSYSSCSFSTARSSFKEDYDEWYSHGRVGSITRQPPTDEHTYYDQQHQGGKTDTTNPGQQPSASFLLDEIRQEEAMLDKSKQHINDYDGHGFHIEPVEEMIFDSHLNHHHHHGIEEGDDGSTLFADGTLDDEDYFAFVEDLHEDDFTFEVESPRDDSLDEDFQVDE